MIEIDDIYRAVRNLEARYPGRRFTPDGIMVGSIGEVLATELYDLKLLPTNTPNYDATDSAGRKVQIRTNQGDATPLDKECEYLLALKLHQDGTIEEIYNGPGVLPWALREHIRPDPQGFYHIRHNKLRRLMQNVSQANRIKRRDT